MEEVVEEIIRDGGGTGIVRAQAEAVSGRDPGRVPKCR